MNILIIINKFFTQLIIFFIKVYSLVLSPLIGKNCRFTPTCSEYALILLKKYKFFKGVFFIVKRLCKCNPFHPGGLDIPP